MQLLASCTRNVPTFVLHPFHFRKQYSRLHYMMCRFHIHIPFSDSQVYRVLVLCLTCLEVHLTQCIPTAYARQMVRPKDPGKLSAWEQKIIIQPVSHLFLLFLAYNQSMFYRVSNEPS